MLQPSTVSSSRPSQMLTYYLSSQEKEKLYDLLSKHQFLFKGTLALEPTKPVQFEMRSNAKPFHGCTFSVPKAYESMIHIEKSTAFAFSMSFASATKANGLNLHLELPRKMVRFDWSQTSAN
jgi:hypothetical protein